MVSTIEITSEVARGTKTRKLPRLKERSPGRRPSPSRPPATKTAPTTTTTTPNTIKVRPMSDAFTAAVLPPP